MTLNVSVISDGLENSATRILTSVNHRHAQCLVHSPVRMVTQLIPVSAKLDSQDKIVVMT